MLNKKGQRELCYLVTIDEIKPIEGKDRVECAVVGGWTIMVRKGQFKPGDVGIYFEIDSKVPVRPEFEFLAAKHYKIKTQKYGNFYSQGLLMSVIDFEGWWINANKHVVDDEGEIHDVDNDTRFLTEKLGVKYSVESDNKRKAKSVDKYQKMAQRVGKKFSKQPYKWLMKRLWGRKLLYVFYGKKSDSRGWPEWVKKTDEERVENMAWILENKNPWIATEKIDGTSTTFTMKRFSKQFKKDDYLFLVCSRNVCFDKPERDCYYDTNVYLEMAVKYDIENKMKKMMDDDPDLEWITIQGETYGAGVQKNNYDLDEHRLAVFNFITSKEGRWNTERMINYLDTFEIPCVPLLDNNYILPDTIEELREYVHSEKSKISNKIKEGIVFRDYEGVRSFKCVDPNYLVKYHE